MSTQEIVEVKGNQNLNREEEIKTANHYRDNEKGDGQSKVIRFDKQKGFWSTKINTFSIYIQYLQKPTLTVRSEQWEFVWEVISENTMWEVGTVKQG